VWLRRGIEVNRNYSLEHWYLAAALARLGRLDEAREAVAAGLSLDPSFTLHRFRMGVFSDNALYLARRERTIDDMRTAGVPVS
jgi:Tetratricopeptide repeat